MASCVFHFSISSIRKVPRSAFAKYLQGQKLKSTTGVKNAWVEFSLEPRSFVSHHCMDERTALSSVEVNRFAVKNISGIPNASLLACGQVVWGAFPASQNLHIRRVCEKPPCEQMPAIESMPSWWIA